MGLASASASPSASAILFKKKKIWASSSSEGLFVVLSCSVSGAPAQSKMDERPILTGQGLQDQDAMDLAPDRDLLWESYLDPGH